MNYQQTLDYLYNRLPVFQKQGASALKPKLDNILLLCQYLGNPQQELTYIHVAGTNGKGSTSHMLSAVFQEHGFKTGLYTSPHLKSFTERIRVNGIEISPKDVVEFVELIQDQIERIEPSFFEVTVAMAFWYFKVQQTDLVILEVGMGGRLDSTNIITPLVSVITNISLDHQQYLGDTLQAIAAEKAGIIKPQIPVVIGEIQAETLPVFDRIARENHSPMVTELNNTELLKALQTNSYQDKNTSTVLKTLETLAPYYTFDELLVKKALQNFKNISGLKGRWQTLGNDPLIICDTAHNVAGISEVLQLIGQQDHHKLHMVLGMVADKDITAVLALLPTSAQYYFCKASIERAMPVQKLVELAAEHQLVGMGFPTVEEAIQQAKKNASKDDLIFIGGSTFVVAEIPFL